MSKIPEINIKLTEVEVKGGVKRKMTVRNMFYRGFKGKISTIWAWFRWHNHQSWSEYLDSPVTYEVELGDVSFYHDIDAEKELTKLLEDEVTKKLEDEREHNG